MERESPWQATSHSASQETPLFMWPRFSQPCSPQQATNPYSDKDESSPVLSWTVLIWFSHPPTPLSSQVIPFSSNQYILRISHLPHADYMLCLLFRHCFHDTNNTPQNR
jgi:hypothetical protein